MSSALEGTMPSALHQYVHRPQQVALRRAMVQIHLWAGLLVALYIIAIGVSGSVLVFKDELMPRPRFLGAAPDTRACTAAMLMRATETAARAYPAHEVMVASCPTVADPFFAVNLKDRLRGERGMASLRRISIR